MYKTSLNRIILKQKLFRCSDFGYNYSGILFKHDKKTPEFFYYTFKNNILICIYIKDESCNLQKLNLI